VISKRASEDAQTALEALREFLSSDRYEET
jgi:hypothetical protein